METKLYARQTLSGESAVFTEICFELPEDFDPQNPDRHKDDPEVEAWVLARGAGFDNTMPIIKATNWYEPVTPHGIVLKGAVAKNFIQRAIEAKKQQIEKDRIKKARELRVNKNYL